jgi:Fur family ferric uptake transcriptional regulator
MDQSAVRSDAGYTLGMRQNVDEIGGLLQAAGLRRTAVRVAVLRVLGREGKPLSAPQVQAKLPGAIDKVTLYRTLNTLATKNLLHRFRGDDRVWRYGKGDAKGKSKGKAQHEHAHCVCDECGAMECLPVTPTAAKAVKSSGVRRGYRVDYSEVLVHGACPDCRG